MISPAYASTIVSEAAWQYKAAAANSHLSKWDFLNLTLGGWLQKGMPVSAPCFPVIGGKDVTVNSSACAAVPTIRHEKLVFTDIDAVEP